MPSEREKPEIPFDNKIKAMVAQGKSLDEIKTSFGEPTAAPPPNPNGAPPAATLTEVIYKECRRRASNA
jgi:hypothetical protein